MFTKGDKVLPSGAGRTSAWPLRPGTVTKVKRTSVLVVWDGTSFEDEMKPQEVKAA